MLQRRQTTTYDKDCVANGRQTRDQCRRVCLVAKGEQQVGFVHHQHAQRSDIEVLFGGVSVTNISSTLQSSGSLQTHLGLHVLQNTRRRADHNPRAFQQRSSVEGKAVRKKVVWVQTSHFPAHRWAFRL